MNCRNPWRPTVVHHAHLGVHVDRVLSVVLDAVDRDPTGSRRHHLAHGRDPGSVNFGHFAGGPAPIVRDVAFIDGKLKELLAS